MFTGTQFLFVSSLTEIQQVENIIILSSIIHNSYCLGLVLVPYPVFVAIAGTLVFSLSSFILT